MKESDTIAALATARGKGALAIVRISGSESQRIVRSNILETEKFDKSSNNEIKLYKYIRKSNKKEIIDEVTIIKYNAPYSYTGEEMVEIICHGGEIVVERILESLIQDGIRYAEKGEYTKRAFINGKTDIIKAESTNILINSKSIIQHKSAIDNYFGNYKSKLKNWKEYIENILIENEVIIEFSENEDVEELNENKKIKEIIEKIKKEIKAELKIREKFKEVEQGLDIAIVGPCNAGKSSILNLLLGYERSIVDYEKGTTRNFITEIRNINNINVRLIDTAGIENTEERIEKESIKKTWEIIKKSKIILLITAADEETKKVELELKIDEKKKYFGIINKTDLKNGIEKEKMFKKLSIPYIKTVAIKKSERDKVEKFIINEISDIYKNVDYNSIILNKRQEMLIHKIFNELKELEFRFKNKENEIVTYHCKNILEKFEEYIGKTNNEDMLNKIFNEFCIGK